MTTTALALPTIADATLPASYARAQTALATCSRVDECKDWADKAAALASYAKQADDKTLYTFALRIQSRAVRRAGELLEAFQSVGGRPPKTRADTGPSSSQRDAAAEAGMSPRQAKTARRVAAIPQSEFDQAIASDDPPTITALAERGTDKRQTNRGNSPVEPAPPGFTEATHVIGIVHELAAFCAAQPAAVVGSAVLPHEVDQLRADAAAVGDWLAECFAHLPEAPC